MILKPRRKEQTSKVRIYIDGIWDLFHYGHANAIKQAKATFENSELIVGINTDEDAEFYQGQQVLNLEERMI
jgi:choline-phosphate cytidylyltransferase